MDAERLSALESQLRSVQARLRELDAGTEAQSRRDLYRMSMLGVEHMRDDFITQLKHYKNLIWNSSFEVLAGAGPANWTAGAQSADASWEGTYSLKLTPGQVAAQAPAAWISPEWYGGGTTRVAFLYKFGGGTCQVLNGAGVVLYTETMEFAQDWPPGRVQFVFDPGDAAQVYLQFTNTSTTDDMYVDAVQLEPDLSGKWASLYSDGPFSAAGGGGTTQGVRSATLVVAASDSKSRIGADYVCDGISDQGRINAAIQALPVAGGRVVLLEGTYNITDTILVRRSNVTLMGQGAGTVIRGYAAFRAPPAAPVVKVIGSAPTSTVTAGTKKFCVTYTMGDGANLDSYQSPTVQITVAANDVISVTDSSLSWRPGVTSMTVFQQFETFSGGDYEYDGIGTIAAPGGSAVIDNEDHTGTQPQWGPHPGYMISLSHAPAPPAGATLNGFTLDAGLIGDVTSGVFTNAVLAFKTSRTTLKALTLRQFSQHGIFMDTCTQARVDDCAIDGQMWGLQILNCTDCMVSNNRFRPTLPALYGIHVAVTVTGTSTGHIITGNLLRNVTWAVVVEQTAHVLLSNNRAWIDTPAQPHALSGGSTSGYSVEDSPAATLSNNLAESFTVGLSIFACTGAVVNGNRITAEAAPAGPGHAAYPGIGIWLRDGVAACLVTGNNIVAPDVGIHLELTCTRNTVQSNLITAAGTMTACIWITADCDDNWIALNDLLTAAVQRLRNDSGTTTTVPGNRGVDY